jgi:hypothetical protein
LPAGQVAEGPAAVTAGELDVIWQSLKDDGGKKYGFLREAEEYAILQDCL